MSNESDFSSVEGKLLHRPVKSGEPAEPLNFSAVYGENGGQVKPAIISPESQEILRRIGSTPLAALSFAAPAGAVGTAADENGESYYNDAQGNNLGLVPSKLISN